MGEVSWYYPETVDEATSLLSREGIIAHGGGTSILRGGLKRVRGLVDLSRLPLRYHRHHGTTCELGACLSFAEVSEYLSVLDGGNVLAEALGSAATTPLRNRITLGGSLAIFPAWSDLMGPLIALGAEVELAGKAEKRVPVTRYVEDSSLRRGALILGIRVRTDSWRFSYHRETRTAADHPAFTLTLLLKEKSDCIDEFRGVVVGCSGRYQRLGRLEEKLLGQPSRGTFPDDVSDYVDVSFTGKKFLSPLYLRHLLQVQVERGIAELLEK
jgi:CO/xanthine dehydrogenase FAD-binding subunit